MGQRSTERIILHFTMSEERSDTPPPGRVIAHLDMDAFYASVELLRRPELRGQPLVVGGRGRPTPDSRGVVTTCSYEARAFGVKSGMPLRHALARCPQAVFVPTDFDEYRRVSRLFKAAIAEIAPQIEDRGIDEVYVDLSDVPGVDVEGGTAVAREIKHNVFVRTGLTCSVGIAPNKLLAKIASELDKPDGVTRIAAGDLQSRIWPLPARRINGIGPKAEARLLQLGIDTIGALAATPLARLREHFGPTYAAWLHAAAHGRDDRPIVLEAEPRSRSRETTFAEDLHPLRQRAEIDRWLARLSAQVARDLQARGYVGKTIGVKLRFDNFVTVTRDVTLETATAQPARIEQAVHACLARVPLKRRIRLLGVRAANLLVASVAETDLFD